MVDTVADLTANSLPAAPGTAPVQIVAAALAASGDGRLFSVWPIPSGFCTTFRHGGAGDRLHRIAHHWAPSGERRARRFLLRRRMGSVQPAGSLLAQFARRRRDCWPWVRTRSIPAAGIIYAQIPQAACRRAVPHAALRSSRSWMPTTSRCGNVLRLPENLAGRAVLNAQADTLYAVSDSGVLVLPVGSLGQFPPAGGGPGGPGVSRKLLPARRHHPDVADRRSGRRTDCFRPQLGLGRGDDFAVLRPHARNGTGDGRSRNVSGPPRHGNRVARTISSSEAVNLPPPVRILVNNQRPDEGDPRRMFPALWSDLLADPARDRFYMFRQDRNQVLVFDGSGLFLVATLRTSNTPTRMAITLDGQVLCWWGTTIRNMIYVYDLDTFQQLPPVVIPRATIHARSRLPETPSWRRPACRAGPTPSIASIFSPARPRRSPSLGVFQNSINADTVLAGHPNGGAILAASADGNVMLYDAGADTFTVSRKLPAALNRRLRGVRRRPVCGRQQSAQRFAQCPPGPGRVRILLGLRISGRAGLCV